MLLDKFFAEFIGTFVFLAVIITTVESHNIYATAQAWLKIGLALSVAILAFGFISGGHFNPAVSVMFYADNRINFEDLIVYVVAQILGGITAYFYYIYSKSYLNK